MASQNDSNFRILLLTDIHYSSADNEAPPDEGGPCFSLGKELITNAVRDARRRGRVDAVIVLGDMIDDSLGPNSHSDLLRVKAALNKSVGDIPLLFVPGNHDGDPSEVLSTFEASEGLYEVGGFRFFIFADPFRDQMYCTRRVSDLDKLARVAADPGGPIIALQHNPLSPKVTGTAYPYMHTNRELILRAYRDAGVLLSLSGHYHPGQDLNEAEGVWFYTAPALCKAPFKYSLVTIGPDRQVGVERIPLKHGATPPIVDRHAHTEFAFCTKRVTAADAVSRAKTFGLSGIVLVEHAPQLYCSPDSFWAAEHIRKPRIWKQKEHSRMETFLDHVSPLRDDFVQIGLEVELDSNGKLTLLREDRERIDLIVGAVHWLMEDDAGMTSDETARLWLRTTEGLLEQGVDVLAHPLRYLSWSKQPRPTHLYGTVAQRLADTHTAAEVNFHANTPDPTFVAECLERGVKISLGSDAHRPWECAYFHPHLDLLRTVAGTDDIEEFLY